VNLDYFDLVAYGNLWDNHCHRLEKAGHAPFWHAPERYNRLLAKFADDVTVGLSSWG
jgi:pimeloyl-ACP methyl ester carboxylesterase